MVLLDWTLIFLLLALIAALFGFSNLARGSAQIAKVLFFIFLIIYIISVVMRNM